MIKLRALLTLIVLANLTVSAIGATIKGQIYTWELEKVEAIVEINTTPKQRIVAINGSYEFVVPIGTYEIRAYSVDGSLECNETVVVKNDGTYVIDLILFPKLEYEEFNFTEPNLIVEESYSPIFIFTALICCTVTAFVVYVFFKRKKSFEELPDDLRKILEILNSMGGRATQKELRERLGWSEAKLSLALTDLERRGFIERYRKGRGNVIFLKT